MRLLPPLCTATNFFRRTGSITPSSIYLMETEFTRLTEPHSGSDQTQSGLRCLRGALALLIRLAQQSGQDYHLSSWNTLGNHRRK